MTSVKLAGLISLIGVAVCGPVSAQQGTDAQREACTPDAFRLCMSAMPDSGRVEGCLRAAGPRLSPACYAVFNPPQQQVETTGQVRERGSRVQREVQRQPQRDFGPRDYDRSREFRRDDGFGNFQRGDRSRPPQPQFDDD